MSEAGGLLQGIVGGWQLSGITTLTTGRPFTVTLQTGVNNGAPSWPNRIGSGVLENPTVDSWFNPADFVAPPAEHLRRQRARHPLRPWSRELRCVAVEAVQRFGPVEPGDPVGCLQPVQPSGLRLPEFGNIGNPNAGRITTTIVDNRSMQFALKFNF